MPFDLLNQQGNVMWSLHGLSAVLVAVLAAVTYYLFPRDGAAVILHYSVGVGIDFIGEGRQIYTLPIIGGLLWAFNVGLGHALLPVSARASWILWSINPIAQAFLLIAFFLIWQLNR